MTYVRVFWMTDPEGGAVKSPFVRQPHYNDLENRIRALEAALRDLVELADITKHIDADALTGRVRRAYEVLKSSAPECDAVEGAHNLEQSIERGTR